MDTPDRAASMADPDLADAINREHLLASASFGRSSEFYHQSLTRRQWQQQQQHHHHQHHQLGFSTSNYFDCDTDYGSSSSQLNRYRDNEYCNNKSTIRADDNQCSWLLRNQNINQREPNTKQHSINVNLYANISFNGLPASLMNDGVALNDTQHEASTPISHSRSPLHQNQTSSAGAGCCFGHFRIFLSCYLLLGVTLAIYSRNALSLAAVKMVANNEINNGLFALFSSLDASVSTMNQVGNKPQSNTLNDGSCPIENIKNANGSPEAAGGQTIHDNELASYLPAFVEKKHANRSQLTTAFRALVKNRVDSGELVDWSPSEQGMIFAAGSVGNLLMAIPLSRFGEIYGAKWIIFISVLGATLQAGLMPTISTCHVSLVILFQIVFNGLTFGADCVSYTLFAHWLTPTEMSFFVACLMTCYQLGTIISSFVSSKLLVLGIHWCWCFYTPEAILCGVWTFFWALLSASEPSKSWWISRKELNFLQRKSKMSQMINDLAKTNQAQQKYCSSTPAVAAANAHMPIDWCKLAKDPNIWALISVKFSLRWFFSVYASLMPTYLSSVLHMSVGLIGKVSVIQSSIGLVLGILIGYFTKSVVNKRPFNQSLATFRKIFQSIVSFGLALSLLAIVIVDCNQWITIIFLTLNGICINFYVAAALQVPLDLSPAHCGLVTSITTTLALGQAIGAPISGLILNNGPANRSLWQIVWLISILLNTFSGLLFIFLVDSKPKDYNKYPTLSDNNQIRGEMRQERSTKIN